MFLFNLIKVKSIVPRLIVIGKFFSYPIKHAIHISSNNDDHLLTVFAGRNLKVTIQRNSITDGIFPPKSNNMQSSLHNYIQSILWLFYSWNQLPSLNTKLSQQCHGSSKPRECFDQDGTRVPGSETRRSGNAVYRNRYQPPGCEEGMLAVY